MSITIKINENDFPMLKKLKKKDMNEYLLKIFKTGYTIHFPSNNTIEQQIEIKQLEETINNVKSEIIDEINSNNINDKINSLESTLNRLIGISSNSCKKGEFGELLLEEIISQRYGDIVYDKKSHTPHSGDAWLYFPDGKKIILEIKNYNYTVNKDEITKLQSDMITCNIKWGLFVSLNSNIMGMKEMDFHTFTHNNTTYSVIMISNLSTDITKLDLGMQLIRKLIGTLDDMNCFPWIKKDINSSLDELYQIVNKNYILRDSYYSMERDIIKNLSSYHTILRNYQYEIEMKINQLIEKISSITSTIKKSDDYKTILDKHSNKKIISLLVRIVDLAQNKGWILEDSENDINIYNNNSIIGCIKLQAKKIIFNWYDSDISFNFHIGKDKENNYNLNLINQFNKSI